MLSSDKQSFGRVRGRPFWGPTTVAITGNRSEPRLLPVVLRTLCVAIRTGGGSMGFARRSAHRAGAQACGAATSNRPICSPASRGAPAAAVVSACWTGGSTAASRIRSAGRRSVAMRLQPLATPDNAILESLRAQLRPAAIMAIIDGLLVEFTTPTRARGPETASTGTRNARPRDCQRGGVGGEIRIERRIRGLSSTSTGPATSSISYRENRGVNCFPRPTRCSSACRACRTCRCVCRARSRESP